MGPRRPTLLIGPVLLVILALVEPTPATAQTGGAHARVPEAADYKLVYDLEVPQSASFNLESVPYSVDRSLDLAESFDRVAYYLELTSPDGETDWMYASMRAFTDDLTLIGVPFRDTGALWQRNVGELTVRSNVEGITTGTQMVGGNLEFWSTNYGASNAAAVSGARDELYDWGDAPSTSGDYGSMQIHNHWAGQTVFAYNRWGDSESSPSDIGIGSNTVAAGTGLVHPDWTFRGNAAHFAARRLQVLVRPGPTPVDLLVSSPGPHRVVQRDAVDYANVPIIVRAHNGVRQVRARGRPIDGHAGESTDWRLIDDGFAAEPSQGTLRLHSGWYSIDVRVTYADGSVAETTVAPVGVGEVFVTAGQSNSANSGWPPLSPTDPRVSAYGPSGWRPAYDPQPIATGNGGTPWPVLGDLLVARLDVPVGLVSVGWGGTRVDQWLPGLDLYPRLRDALEALGPTGARAVLWHQGESDASAGTPADRYAERLSLVIDRSRIDAGYDVPWGIALVSYLPNGAVERMAQIVAGQRAVLGADPLTFEGPTTDDLVGDDWRHDGIHFNEAGMREHARRWNAAIKIPATLPTTNYLPYLTP